MSKVLVVDDDPTVREVVVSYLRAEKYAVSEAADGETALALVSRERPDVVVLDVMLPGVDGLAVCRQLKAGGDTTRVLLLTALGTESDRVFGLEIGADDYLTKPFSPRELVLRVGSLLRRSGQIPNDAAVLIDGDLVVDGPSRQVTRAGVAVSLTVREFDLLWFLVSHPHTAFTRVELLEQVWGWSFGDQSTVTVHVRRLREKIEPEPTTPVRLVTVWGVGYRWAPS